MKFTFPKLNSDQVQSYPRNFKSLKEENLAWNSRRLASRKLVQPMLKGPTSTRQLVRTSSALLPAKRLCSHKEPFPRPRGIGKLCLPILRVEEPCQWSPQWAHKWCVIMIKMNDNLTQHFIGTPQGQYCSMLLHNREHEISQINNDFNFFS